MPEIPETFTETYGFHLDCAKDGVKLFDEAVNFENSHLSTASLSLLAVGNFKKVYVASNGAQVAIGHVESLEEDRKFYDIPNTTIVALSADNEYVFLVADGTLKRISTDKFLQGDQDLEVVASDVKNFKPSPNYSNLSAVLLNDGTLQIYESTRPIHSISKIAAFTWSHDGSAVATVSGKIFSVHRYDGDILLTYTDPLNTFDGLIAVAENQWLLMSAPTPDDTQFTLLKQEGLNFTLFEVPLAPCFGEVERASQIYDATLHGWIEGKSLTLVTSALSTEISSIETIDGTSNLIAHANDTDRAELPMFDDEDTLPVGIAVDITGTSRIVKEPCEGVEEANGVLPRLFCLNHQGNLVIWDIFDSVEIHKDTLSLERALPHLSKAEVKAGSPLIQPTTVVPPKSETTDQVPVIEKETKEETKHKPAAPPASPFRTVVDAQGTGTTSFGGSGFGSSGFGSSGFGSSGFGTPGFASSTTTSSSGFGQSGFATQSASSGFGESGFGKSGFGQKKETKDSGVEVKSGFGSYASKSNAFSSDKPSPFANTSGDIFGSLGTDLESLKPSIFGSSSALKPFGSSEPTKSIFGSTSSAKPFGSSEPTKSIFGSDSSAKPFGSSTETKSIFGDSASTKPFGSSTETKSIFGDSSNAKPFDSQAQSGSLFGQQSNEKPFGSTEGSSSAFALSKLFKATPSMESPFAKLSFADSNTKANDSNDKPESSNASTSTFDAFGKLGLEKTASQPSKPTEEKTSLFGIPSRHSEAGENGDQILPSLKEPFIDDKSEKKKPTLSFGTQTSTAFEKPSTESKAPSSKLPSTSPFAILNESKAAEPTIEKAPEASDQGKQDATEKVTNIFKTTEKPEESDKTPAASEVDNSVLSSEETSKEQSAEPASSPTATKPQDSVSKINEKGSAIIGQTQSLNQEHPQAKLSTEKLKRWSSEAIYEEAIRRGYKTTSDGKIILKATSDVPKAEIAKEKDEQEGATPVESETKKELPPPLEDHQLRVFARLGELENKGTRVEQEMRTVLQTTDAMLKVFRINARIIEDKMKALSFDKDVNDYRRLGTAKHITKEVQKTRQDVKTALSAARKFNDSMSEVMKVFKKTEESISSSGDLILLISHYERSISLENLTERPLEIQGEILKQRLRKKLANVQSLYDKSLQLLLPLGVLGSDGVARIEKLEEVVFEISCKIKTLSKHIAQLESEIAELAPPKLIKNEPEPKHKPLSFQETKWSWAKSLSNPTVVESEF